MSEKEEDAEILKEPNNVQETIITASPGFIQGTMRDYQLKGLSWMLRLHDNGINGILADEMGLGKTLQTISLIGYLKHFRGINGPHIVITPKSTLQNWVNEFNRFCPSIKVRQWNEKMIEKYDKDRQMRS